jgi:ABC-type dipeptide/oligopeptide/nickel transport system permease subunit
MALFPGAAIVVAVVGLNLLGDGLADGSIRDARADAPG